MKGSDIVENVNLGSGAAIFEPWPCERAISYGLQFESFQSFS